jgi:hypothetical protein
VIIGVVLAIFAIVAAAFVFSGSVTVVAPSQDLSFILWLTMVVSAIGVVVYRRAKFSALRLQAVANTRGTNGLIASLHHTSVNLALICLGIAALGFTLTMLTGDIAVWKQTGDFYALWGAGVLRGAIIALVLLIGYYPRRRAWQQTIESLQPPEQTPPSTGGVAA